MFNFFWHEQSKYPKHDEKHYKMKFYSQSVIGILILLLVTNCTLESKFSLPNDEKINHELIGEWHNTKDNEEKLSITKNGEKTYKLVLKDNKKIDTLISYSKTIQGFEIMNIKVEFDNKVTNLFYGFKVERDTLIFSEVNSTLTDKEFESQTELLNFFKENINREDFFTVKTELVRK